MKANTLFKWLYIVLAIMPIGWFILAISWSIYISAHFDVQPSNDELYAIKTDNVMGRTLDAYYNIGKSYFGVLAISFLVMILTLLSNIIWAVYGKNKFKMDYMISGICLLLYLLLFVAQVWRVEAKFMDFLFD